MRRRVASLDALGSRVGLLSVTMLLWCGLCTSCASQTPQFPSVEGTPDVVAGVAWFDDGNGSIDADELPAAGLSVRLGLTRQVFASASGDQTDQAGGFVMGFPDFLEDIDTGIFVEVEIPTGGPDGSPITIHHRVATTRGDDRIMVPVRRPTKCSATLDAMRQSSDVCGQVQLPDLVPLAEDFGQPPTQPIATDSVWLDTSTLPGSDLLRFASATANLGTGPLHMIPESSPSGQRAQTWQRVWTDDGSYADHRTGEFVFHESHDHFHLEAFEQYRLLTTAGQVIRTGEKVSFCLIDSLPALDSAQTLGQGIFLNVICENAGDQQALNPGWADYYGAGLPDQWIDVTGVEPGDYLVEIVVDPENLLIESDESNNRATFPVTLQFENRDDPD